MKKIEKKHYHHGDLKKAIVEAAMGIIRAEGIKTLSLRNVSARIGVSHSALYRHYAGKEDLVVSIALSGFDKLADEMSAAEERPTGAPPEELIEMGRTYIRFAVENPVYYRLMFGDYIDNKTEYPGLFKSYDFWFSRIIDILKRCEEGGKKSALDLRIQALAVWSLLHGYASLVIDNRKDKNVGSEGQIHLVLKQLRKLV